MIVKIAEQNFEFDLSKSIGQRELLDKLFLAYRNKFPFFINLLISICEIKNVEQEHKFALAYTKLNIDSERIDIFLNFEKMQKKNFTAEEFLYLIFHELLHNYFYHFQRFKEFDKDGYSELSNIVQDYYVNAYCNELIGEHVYKNLKNKKINGINYDSISELCNFNNISGLPKEEELRQQWTDIKLMKFLINNGTKKNSPSNDNGKDKNGNNNIIVIAGSNFKITENDIQNKINVIAENDIVILQNEIPLSVVEFCLLKAKELGKITVFNPAPATKLNDRIFHNTDYLILNETEMEEIFEIKIFNEGYTEKMLCKKEENGIKNIILTLGEKGCVYFDKNNDVNKYEAYKVKAVDTTAAGDSFIGAFAMKICECGDTGEAIKYATAVSAIVVTRQGAQSSIPTKDEIKDFLRKN